MKQIVHSSLFNLKLRYRKSSRICCHSLGSCHCAMNQKSQSTQIRPEIVVTANHSQVYTNSKHCVNPVMTISVKEMCKCVFVFVFIF